MMNITQQFNYDITLYISSLTFIYLIKNNNNNILLNT